MTNASRKQSGGIENDRTPLRFDDGLAWIFRKGTFHQSAGNAQEPRPRNWWAPVRLHGQHNLDRQRAAALGYGALLFYRRPARLRRLHLSDFAPNGRKAQSRIPIPWWGLWFRDIDRVPVSHSHPPIPAKTVGAGSAPRKSKVSGSISPWRWWSDQ